MKETNELLQLLRSYKEKERALHALEKNEAFREWREDYQVRFNEGALHSPSIEKAGATKRNLSIQENLLLERAHIEDKVESWKMQISLTRFLLFHLSDAEYQLVYLRCIEGRTANEVCKQLFMSRSAMYRKLNKILKKMDTYYQMFKKNNRPDD